MKKKLLNMIYLQNRLNRAVHREWEQECFEWRRAILVESAELMEHHGWKWWKHQTPDLPQVHLELIDIFHFMLSWSMEIDDDYHVTATKIANSLSVPAQGPGDFLDNIELFVSLTLSVNSPRWQHFAGLMKAAGLSFDELYKWYMGKNALNRFRQDQGYKTGSYRKVWCGREDNEYLADILSTASASTPDLFNEIYSELSAIYRATKLQVVALGGMLSDKAIRKIREDLNIGLRNEITSTHRS